MSPNFTDLTICLVSLFLIIYIRQRNRSSVHLPPGPKKLPFIGSLLDIPTTNGWITYAQWGKEFDSDIIHLKIINTDIIVLNSLKAAVDLLEKRSAIYSNRPRFIMVCELMGWDWFFSAMPYGDGWRERRKLFTQHFHPSDMKAHHSREEEYVPKLLAQLLDTPEDFISHVHHMMGGISFSVAYGINIEKTDDPYVELADKAMASISEAGSPGAFLVDTIPLLNIIPEWFPGGGFKKLAKEWRVLAHQFRDAPFEAARKALAEGTSQPSFTSLCLERHDESPNPEYQKQVIKDTAAMFFGAGSDTTVSAINTFILAMTCYPEVQAKAQQELHRVVGSGRLPDFNDKPSLPYLSAIVKEVLRWQPVGPQGVPHSVIEHDIYKGYHIPKDSVVISNIWGIMHNEEDFPIPSEFNPERYLKNGKIDPTVLDPENIAFGFGRRICPGAHIALSTIFVTAASILTTFTISKAIDEKNNIVEPSLEYKSSAIVSHPIPFNCLIKPRSEKAVALIRSSIEQRT